MFVEDNKIPLSMLRISYLNLSRFTGSYKNKRYIFEKSKNENNNDILLLYIYPDVVCFEKTAPNDIQKFEFTYDKQGIKDGLDFLSKIFD